MNSIILKIKNLFNKFSLVEKVVFLTLFGLLVISASALIWFTAISFGRQVPARGGELDEGVVGYPSFINPLLSVTNSAKDLSLLTYSGLMKVDEKGNIVPDLAESYTISSDGKTYTFVLRKDIVFHDNQPITSQDVLFTIEKAKDPKVKSSVASNWRGVDVKIVDAQTIQFILKTPYAPFIENTTLGILPKHIWENADIDQFTFSPYNFNPIGSGPYKVSEVKRDSKGVLVYYKLTAFNKYTPGVKNISTIYIHFYEDEQSLIDAIKKGEVQSSSDVSPENAKMLEQKGFTVATAPLLRIFGVFFNQNQATIFTNKEVRQALQLSVDRNEIIDKVLYGYGTEESSVIPQSSPLTSTTTINSTSTDSGISDAKTLLAKNGWKLNAQGVMEKKDKKQTLTLSFTITTSNNPDLAKTAEILKEEWSKIGANVTIVTLDPSELNQNVIRPRKYDVLLFGEVVGRESDLYPFWHSSERKDPGLNIALYTNSNADKLLEKLRASTNASDITKTLSSLETMITNDVPAIFIYSPELTYVVPKELKNLNLPPLEITSERWIGIFNAYLKTKTVWR